MASSSCEIHNFENIKEHYYCFNSSVHNVPIMLNPLDNPVPFWCTIASPKWYTILQRVKQNREIVD